MTEVLTVYRGDNILTDERDAGALRSKVEAILGESDDSVAVLDFTGVNGVAHGFADELFAPLFDLLGEAMPDRVLLDNCSAAVLGDLRCLAEMGRRVAVCLPARGRQAA